MYRPHWSGEDVYAHRRLSRKSYASPPRQHRALGPCFSLYPTLPTFIIWRINCCHRNHPYTSFYPQLDLHLFYPDNVLREFPSAYLPAMVSSEPTPKCPFCGFRPSEGDYELLLVRMSLRETRPRDGFRLTEVSTAYRNASSRWPIPLCRRRRSSPVSPGRLRRDCPPGRIDIPSRTPCPRSQ